MSSPPQVPVRVNYSIVFVSDMTRAVSFYRDTLGMPLKFETPGWTEFATEGATFALHASKSATPDDDDLPPGRCRPGFAVPDLDVFHRRMVENDVQCVQEPKAIFGVRVAQYVDPDGQTFSVGEDTRG